MSFQRTTLELGGNVGQLTIGELPGNLSDSSLTYVPVRLYSPEEGGIPGPSSNPSEVRLQSQKTLDKLIKRFPDIPTVCSHFYLLQSGIPTVILVTGKFNLTPFS